jgi:hypothetical protein
MEKIIKKLVSLETRQGTQADKAAEYLIAILKKSKTPFAVKTYRVDMPVWKKFSLKADERDIPCLPTGFTSGNVDGVSAITSSLISSRYFLDTPHLNFNPKCPTISRANFSSAPSLAVSRDSLKELFTAKEIEGTIVVQKKKIKTYQILVGNTRNPKNILFSHFDSIGCGAVDNATGTAVMMELVITHPELLKKNLFVFDGNEEISYDHPVYWGRGYRNFEKKYNKIFKNTQQIIVVDCIGYDKTQILHGKSQRDIARLAFPIKNIETYSSKIRLVTSDYDKLMTVYHSDLDNGDIIRTKYMQEALNIVLELCKPILITPS